MNKVMIQVYDIYERKMRRNNFHNITVNIASNKQIECI